MPYPDEIDTFPTYQDRNIAVGIEGTLIVANMFHIIQNAIVVIQTILGTLPQGSDPTIRERIEAIENEKFDKAGGEITGDVEMKDDKIFYLNTAKTVYLKYSSAESKLYIVATCDYVWFQNFTELYIPATINTAGNNIFLNGGALTQAGDIEHKTDTNGPILIDRVDAKHYRLKVESGVLGIEEVV